MNPYLITSVVFLFFAGLTALDSALTSFQILPWFNGLSWLRVHLITLGALSEALFGILPALAAKRAGLKASRIRWDIWLALTVGLLVLLVGIPLMSYALIVTGGTLIFIAALLLIYHLGGLAPAVSAPDKLVGSGRMFYLAGLSFLLLGIIVGSGVWFGWGRALGMDNPTEVHIHTNIWGFMSLVFAGLIVDLYPSWTGRALAWPGAVRPIFWMMTLGAFAAVLGPWLAVAPLMALGIVVQQVATAWLVVSMIRPLRGAETAQKPGIWHVITAYFWQFAIVLATPLIVLLRPGFSVAGLEQTAPQVLIYGWMLQFGYAVIPYLLRRAVSPQQEAELGGSWFSLAAVHAGGIFLAASIFISNLSSPLLGAAYLLWFFSMLPITRQIWQILILL
jgi:cytochrome c oxidase cbb3-type subunit I